MPAVTPYMKGISKRENILGALTKIQHLSQTFQVVSNCSNFHYLVQSQHLETKKTGVNAQEVKMSAVPKIKAV